MEVHSTKPPRVNPFWDQENLTMENFEVIRPHIAQIVMRRKAGLTREDVATSWLGHRVPPLQQRLNYGFEYTGPEDPGCITKEGLPDAELLD